MYKVLYVSCGEVVDTGMIFPGRRSAERKVRELKGFSTVTEAWVEDTLPEVLPLSGTCSPSCSLCGGTGHTDGESPTPDSWLPPDLTEEDYRAIFGNGG